MGMNREPMPLKKMHRQDLIGLIRSLTEENDQLRKELEAGADSVRTEPVLPPPETETHLAALAEEFRALRRSIDALKVSLDRYAGGSKPREDILVAKKSRRPVDEKRW